MKKTYLLHIEGKNPDRVLEAVKHDIRKYIKRCRSAALPEGADFWDFDCLFGTDAESAGAVHMAELTAKIDTAAKDQHASVFLEITPKTGRRVFQAREPAVAALQ